VDAKLRLVKSDAVAANLPRVSVEAALDTIGISVEPRVVRDVQTLADAVAMRMARLSRAERRPSLSYRGHSAEWWHYAIGETLDVVRRRRVTRTLPGVLSAIRTGQEYAALFKRSLGALSLPALSKLELDRMLAIEQNNTDEFIGALRNATQEAVVREAREVVAAAQLRAAQPPPRRSMFGGLAATFGFSSSKSDEELVVGGVSIKLTPAQLKALEALVAANEEDVVDISSDLSVPQEYVAYCGKFSISKIRVDLKLPPTADAAAPSARKRLVATFEAEGAAVSGEFRKANVEVKATLLSIEALDNSTQVDGKFYRFLYVDRHQQQEDDPEPFFTARFQKAPLDCSADFSVHASLLSVILEYSQPWTRSLSSWGATLSQTMTPNSLAMARAKAAVSEKVKTSQASTEDMVKASMLTHKTFDIQISVRTPIILIPSPDDASNQGSLLTVQLGSVEIASKGTRDGYDVFTLEASGAQVLVGRKSCNWRDQHVADELRMLGPLALKVEAHLSVVRNSPDLTLGKVTSELPSIMIRIHDAHLEQLSKVLSLFNRPVQQCVMPEEPTSTKKNFKSVGRQVLNAVSFTKAASAAASVRKRERETAEDLLAQKGSSKSEISCGNSTSPKFDWKLLDFEFIIPNIDVQLWKDDGKSAMLIFNASNLSVSLNLCSRTSDINIGLSQFCVSDCVALKPAKSDLPLYLLRSCAIEEMQQKFIKLAIKVIDRRSPKFVGSDIAIVANLGKLEVCIASSPYIALVDWQVKNLQRFKLLRTSHKADKPTATKAGKQKANSPSMDVTANFQGIAVILSQFDQERRLEVARAEITGALLKYCQNDTERLIRFELAHVAVLNPVAEEEGSMRFQNIFAPCQPVSGTVTALELKTSVQPIKGSANLIANQDMKVELSRFHLRVDDLFLERILDYVRNFSKALTECSKSEISVEKSSELPEKIDIPQEIRRIYISFKSEGFDVLLPCLPSSEDGILLQVQSLSLKSAPAQCLSESDNTITSPKENGENHLFTTIQDNISFSVDMNILQKSIKTSTFQVTVVSECIRDMKNTSDSIHSETRLKVALQTCTAILRVQDIGLFALIAARQIESFHKLFNSDKHSVNLKNDIETQSEKQKRPPSTSCLDLDFSMEELSIVLHGAGSNNIKSALEPLPLDECAELSIALSQVKFTYVQRSGMSGQGSQSASLLLNHAAVKFCSAQKAPIAGKKHCFPNVLVSAL
jgi:hypothetical protein